MNASVLGLLLLSSALLCGLMKVQGEPTQDEITSLPGYWNKTLPSRMFSGYVDAGPHLVSPKVYGNYMVHYWMVYAEVEEPEKAPVLVWYQGGPGASSLFGLLVEFGPLLLNELSFQNESELTLIENPYSWTKFANVIVVDNPPPVGFSYCSAMGPTAGGNSCGSWNDSLVSQMNSNFLTNLFDEKFPELAKNEIYLIGESYAGIYVPTLVRELLLQPSLNFSLTGMMVGDGCIGTDILCGAREGPYSGPYYDIEFLYGHGQVSIALYKNISSTCTDAELRYANVTKSKACDALLQTFEDTVGDTFYGYNLYDDCNGRNVYGSGGSHAAHSTGSWLHRRRIETAGGDAVKADGTQSSSSSPSAPVSIFSIGQWPGPGYACGGSALGLWLNLTEVREALHIPNASTANFFNEDNGVGFVYNLTEPNLLPFYLQLITSNQEAEVEFGEGNNGGSKKVRVLVYNGDADPGINSFLTQDIYFSYLGAEGVGMEEGGDWQAWTLDNKTRVGGFQTRFQGDFSYVTVRGSGHMVPEYRAEAAHAMLSSWIFQGQLPSFNPSSNTPTSK